MKPPLRALTASTAGAALVAAAVVTLAPAAQAATTTCAQYGTVSVNNNAYIVQNDEWNSTSQQCITVDGTSFSVQANQNLPTNGPPASYPSIYSGCHWGNCTTGSGMPVQVSNLGSATSSWSTTQPASGAYDVAYDIWYNTTPTTSGQPDGTELMIWMNSRGGPQPAGSIVGTATLAGATWNVWQTRMNGWNYVAYQRQQGTTSFANLDIKAFTQDAVNRGQINPAWYLIAIEAGFEIWQGGTGLATNSFSASVTSGSGGTTPPPTTSPPPSGTAACKATYHVDNDWGTGFTATVTVANSGGVATRSWKVTWTWGGNQTITNIWNATAQRSGQTQTAASMDFNGAIATGSATTFGFQASYTGANAIPALSCSAT